MKILPLLALLPVALAVGPECCCDKYGDYGFTSGAEIVADCKALWQQLASGQSNADYCSGIDCLKKATDPIEAAKCGAAALDCGLC